MSLNVIELRTSGADRWAESEANEVSEPVFRSLNSVDRSEPSTVREEVTWAIRDTLPRPWMLRVVLRMTRILWVLTGYFLWKFWAGLFAGADRSQLQRESARRLARMLEGFGGAAVKMGQQMAMRNDLLPQIYCDELRHLLDESPEGIDAGVVLRTVGETLLAKPKLLNRGLFKAGCKPEEAVEAVFPFFDAEHPMGKASMACVYRAVLHTGENVVVKVLRPGVGMTIALDLKVLDWTCRLLEFLTLIQPGLTGSFRSQLRFMLSEELDFRKEIRYQELFRLYHRRRSQFRVSAPKVYYRYSGDRVIVSEFIQGISVKDLQEVLDRRDEVALELFDQLNIDRKVLAKHLIRASFYAFFECPFFHGDPHPGNILVQPGNRIYLLDFGACGVFAEKERKVLRQLHRFKSEGDVGGMVQCVVKLAEPMPPIDVLEFTKELEDVWWHGAYGVESEHPQWWERTSARLWAGLLELSRKHKIPMPLNMLRMIRATLLYDTVAAQLHPKIDVFREYRKYYQDYAERVRCKWIRSISRQALMGPDPTNFVRAEEAIDTANLALFRFRQFLDAPFPRFAALADRIWMFVAGLFRFFGILVLLTGSAWFILMYVYEKEQPGESWLKAPYFFYERWLSEGHISPGKVIVMIWAALVGIAIWRFYRLMKPTFFQKDV